MSLKAIKALSQLCADEGYDPVIISMGEDALEEVEALEKAARTLGVNGCLTAIEDNGHKDEREAVAVLKRIAKEAQ